MAQNTTLTLTAQQWSQMTNADVTTIRVQNISGYNIFVQATTDNTPPANEQGAVELYPGSIFTTSDTLAELFPGIGDGSSFRVWAYGANGGTVSFSHA